MNITKEHITEWLEKTPVDNITEWVTRGFYEDSWSEEVPNKKAIAELIHDCIQDLGPKWVSVEDEVKPVKNKMILCYGFTGESLGNPEEKDYDLGEFDGKYFSFYGQCFGSVTHWMYFPEEPPK